MKKYKKTYKFRCASTYRGTYVQFIIVPTLIWHQKRRGDIDSFIISLAIDNSSLKRLGYDSAITNGSWREIAHSDHNPISGHDIYDPNDPKQLHVDVNHPYSDARYVKVYKKLSHGSPPKPVGKAANMAKEILVVYRDTFLGDFLI